MKVFTAACVFTLVSLPVLAAEPDGLVLPGGFHASIVADGVEGIRHLAFAGKDRLYVSTSPVADQPSPGIIALHLNAAHKVDKMEHFGTVTTGTGIRVYKGWLYAASLTAVVRYKLTSGLVPAGEPQAVITNIPASNFGTHAIAFDGKGGLFVSVNASSNICLDPKTPSGSRPVGLKPCPDLNERAGIWRFDATKTDQKFPADGERYATGVRNINAMDWSTDTGALYGVPHGRDQTHRTFPTLVSQADDDAIADEVHRITKGSDLGWPYTYYDGVRNIRLIGPEYGGDNKTAVDASLYDAPVAAFAPKREAPLDLVFYDGMQFPRSYRGGAFIAMHGANGIKPAGGGGYRIVFMPLDRNGDAGTPVTFADGFAGPGDSRYPATATYRPVGEAVSPDGSLYVADSSKGRIWRIAYSGAKSQTSGRM